MHFWDKFKDTTLQDGEAAARLLSNYGIPKNEPIIRNFIKEYLCIKKTLPCIQG